MTLLPAQFYFSFRRETLCLLFEFFTIIEKFPELFSILLLQAVHKKSRDRVRNIALTYSNNIRQFEIQSSNIRTFGCFKLCGYPSFRNIFLIENSDFSL